MDKALKGALLSGLGFPGLGQILLKSYVRGVAFAVIALACIGTIVGKAVQQARAVLAKMEAAGGAVDVDAISKSAQEAVTGTDSRLVHAALLLLVLCWAVSVVDAYRIGRKAGSRRA